MHYKLPEYPSEPEEETIVAITSITRRQHGESFQRPTTEPNEFRLTPFRGYVLEVEDVHFHHDSSVLLPDYADTPDPARITALAVIGSAYEHAGENPSQQLLIAGHTDTSGQAGYNVGLSQKRANSVLYVLLGDRDSWVSLCKEKHKVEDYQQIVKWASWTYGWNCDPGAIDNVHGGQTTAAVKSFQKNYNETFEQSIGEDGQVGTETWGAFFDVYVDQLKELMDVDDAGLEEARGALKFISQKAVGCGENFPIEAPRADNYRSKINRRVELLFFEPDQVPKLDCHPGTACDPLYCEVYNPKMYKFRHIPVIQPALQAPSVLITELSRWFIPRTENCDIAYSLDGPQTAADKLTLEVYGSNHPELADWNGGLPKFKALADAPVYKRALAAEFAAEKTAKSIDDWKGEADCPKGILSVGADGKPRVVNVACSPYTVMFRYYKEQADEQAAISVQPFWPQFDSAKAPVAASLEIKYSVKNTARLWRGRLSIWDREGTVVFEKALSKNDLMKGDLSFTWDGKTTDGSAIVPEKMPYRVQIQGRTRRGRADGLALAAAHTEVRMYVHPETVAQDINPYVATDDKSSLLLGLADGFHKDALPTRAADGRVWTKTVLAQSGFHPGPVTDETANDAFKVALGEFQRSVPKFKNPAAPPFERLTLSTTGNEDNDTKDALENLAAERRRPWFGKPADKTDYTADSDEFRKDFRNPMKQMIVWVDDRNWYTDPAWLRPPNDDVTPTIRSQVTGHRTAVGNKRGPYTWGDQRVTQDEADIARPWIPIAADCRLLRKTQHLTDVITDTPSDADLEAMRAAIGPLPVDWSFDEIDGAAITVPEIDVTQYHKERTRTKSALEWALDNLKTADYARKDVKAKSNYFNCPVENGGIRPKSGAGYYKEPFGVDGEALLPWKTADDSGRETVVSVFHDRVGQEAAQICTVRRLGRAGVYFHPSRIAGDGYRLRAQVRLEPHGGYDFPNLAVLGKRYPRLPQAHSAALRLWRKISIRGYLCWGPTNSWPGTRAGMLLQHHACHAHVVNELGVSDADVGKTVNDFWSAAQLATFRSVVQSCIAGAADARRMAGNITLTADRMWPWHRHSTLGVLNPVGPNPANPWTDVFTGIVSQINPPWFKLTNRYAMELVDKLETQYGRMRGHVIVEFITTLDFWSRQYRCDSCGGNYHYCARDGTVVSHQNSACPSGCGGRLQDTGSTQHYTQQLPVPSLGDPLGVSYDFDATARLWVHELSHNRYYEHCANAPGANDGQHDHVNNPDPTVSADAFARPAPPDGDGTNASRQWDRCCTMTYINQLASYDAVKDQAFFCYKCVLKNRGWKLAGVNNPPGATKDP
jgi:hypothetical protein